jgi:hypothetical protein
MDLPMITSPSSDVVVFMKNYYENEIWVLYFFSIGVYDWDYKYMKWSSLL